MNREYAWTAGGKVRMWAFWLLTIVIASRFYVVQELLAAFAFFWIGFATLAFVVLSLYLLQKGWELATVRIFDTERSMASDMRAAILLAGDDGVQSKSAQNFKTENRNSKDWSGNGSLDWAGGAKCAERI
jgi:hypothetical protein